MEAKVVKVGTSLGMVIPRFIAVEEKLVQGSPINIEYVDNRIIVTKLEKSRSGWAETFAKYAAEGEDEQMLPDFVDSEAEELI